MHPFSLRIIGIACNQMPAPPPTVIEPGILAHEIPPLVRVDSRLAILFHKIFVDALPPFVSAPDLNRRKSDPVASDMCVVTGPSGESALEAVITVNSRHPRASRDWHEAWKTLKVGSRRATSLPELAKGVPSDACGTE
jgi:hypothetical protein